MTVNTFIEKTITTEKHEYTIIIDDVTKITALGVKALEALKHQF